MNTGLMWEKQSDGDGSVHDRNNLYTWDGAFSGHVATFNGAGFAGHTDWRVPNYKELVSIVNLENITPALSAAFNNNCAPGCTVLTCSCVYANLYWTSSTYADYPSLAWVLDFNNGRTIGGGWKGKQPLRARGARWLLKSTV